MNFSVTVPQLFYDLIARVAPGFLFIMVLKIQLYGTPLNLGPLEQIDTSNFFGALGGSIAYLGLFYFTMGPMFISKFIKTSMDCEDWSSSNTYGGVLEISEECVGEILWKYTYTLQVSLRGEDNKRGVTT